MLIRLWIIGKGAKATEAYPRHYPNIGHLLHISIKDYNSIFHLLYFSLRNFTRIYRIFITYHRHKGKYGIRVVVMFLFHTLRKRHHHRSGIFFVCTYILSQKFSGLHKVMLVVSPSPWQDSKRHKAHVAASVVTYEISRKFVNKSRSFRKNMVWKSEHTNEISITFSYGIRTVISEADYVVSIFIHSENSWLSRSFEEDVNSISNFIFIPWVPL
jgi:hypothetical protein